MSEDKPKKARKAVETIVERRLKDGASVLRTICRDAPTGAFWTFSDDGKAARADVCNRLLSAGKLAPRGDGLFGDSQTFGWAG